MNASSTTWVAKALTLLPAGLPPCRDASPTASLRFRMLLNQLASLAVIRCAATMLGSLAATTCCSRRRLRTASQIASPKIGIIHTR
jgi:hypothetical protein